MQDNNCGKLSGKLEFVQVVGDGGCHASVMNRCLIMLHVLETMDMDLLNTCNPGSTQLCPPLPHQSFFTNFLCV